MLVRWGCQQGREGRVVGGTIIRRWSEQSVLRWMRRLLRKAHPWPHRDGAGPGIIAEGPCGGALAVVIGAARAVSLAFPLPLAFVVVVGVRGQRGRGGEGLPEDTMIPAAVVAGAATAAEDTLLMRAWSRTRRPVPGPLSCPTRSP
jgi:hypothetical protein